MYVIYAREFGWTPEQVDAIPLTVEPWLLPIHNAIRADQNRREEAAAKAASKKK